MANPKEGRRWRVMVTLREDTDPPINQEQLEDAFRCWLEEDLEITVDRVQAVEVTR